MGASITTVTLTDLTVTGDDNVGGLVGDNDRGTVCGSPARGSVSGDTNVGDLVGLNWGTVADTCPV